MFVQCEAKPASTKVKVVKFAFIQHAKNMNARQLVVDWVRTASLFNESSDFTMSRMYKFYSDSKTYCDKKAEVMDDLYFGWSDRSRTRRFY